MGTLRVYPKAIPVIPANDRETPLSADLAVNHPVFSTVSAPLNEPLMFSSIAYLNILSIAKL